MFLNVRKERIHQCGHSNIDFRSNNSESISKFVNARNKLDFVSLNNNLYNSDENSSSNFKSSKSNKKIILKLPFNDHRKINKISEAIENSNDTRFEKAIDPKFNEPNKNLFKIISPIKNYKIKNLYNLNNSNDNEINRENDYGLNRKVDSVIKDIGSNNGIEIKFNKNNITAKSDIELKKHLVSGFDMSENETPSKIFINFLIILI